MLLRPALFYFLPQPLTCFYDLRDHVSNLYHIIMVLHPLVIMAEPPAPRHQPKHNGDCHNAHTADLNQDQNNDLPKQGPVGARVLRDQAGNANGGGCRKQRVKIRRPFAAPCGDR